MNAPYPNDPNPGSVLVFVMGVAYGMLLTLLLLPIGAL